MSDLPVATMDCPECDGHGRWQETESGHGCDGTDEVCAHTCPVPIAVQVECHVCAGSGEVEVPS